MEKSDVFALGAEPGGVIDQSHTCTTTAFQCSVQIIDGEADMVNAGAAFGDELADRRLGGFGLQELDERVARAQTGDPGSIGIVQRLFGQAEQVAVERQNTVERINGDSDVSDSGAFGHWHQSIEGASTIEDARHG
jgi:hypothetical protein